jgi:DnaJ-class molecular chaperone
LTELSDIDQNSRYRVEIKGNTYTVKGSEIISAICPRCHGSGQIAEGGEPKLCEACDGMGMIDYSQATITPA